MISPAMLPIFEPLDFLPQDGEDKTPISVRARFIAHSSDRVFLRIVVGDLAIKTDIFDAGTGDHTYRLEGVMPPFQTVRSSGTHVPVSIQALDTEGMVLRDESVGHFRYWVNGHGSPQSSRARTSSLSVPVPSSPLSPVFSSQASRRTSISTVPSSPAAPRLRRVLRRREASDGPEDLRDHVVLDYLTPLEDMSCNLTEEERQLGRRLVQFDCRLEGNCLKISCRPIRQEDYRDDEQRTMTISCIYRATTNLTYFTSVDVIQLLQHLADERFKVEEKNRIRRNLEGFHPTTISKNRPNLESFFTQIMEFPAPKPRNIEKDVKVFTWDNLGPAIDKIMSKYSIINENDSLDSPIVMHTPILPDTGLGLPPYHHPSQDSQPHQSMYVNILDPQFSSPSFETASSRSSDGDRGEFSYRPAPNSAFSSPHHHSQPLFQGTGLYHSPPVDSAASYGLGIPYGRTVPSPVISYYA